jgi:hypothetical protein
MVKPPCRGHSRPRRRIRSSAGSGATLTANRVVALQISGEAPAPGYSFNQVNLGDGIDKLMGQFASPHHVGPSGLDKTELWSYGPWPFSFEVRGDRVTSIRISDPTVGAK